jgi:hypothetical protein
MEHNKGLFDMPSRQLTQGKPDEELYELDVSKWLGETEKSVKIESPLGFFAYVPKSQVRGRSDTSIVVTMWWADISTTRQTVEERSKELPEAS